MTRFLLPLHYITEMNISAQDCLHRQVSLARQLVHVREWKDTTTGSNGIKIDLDAC